MTAISTDVLVNHLHRALVDAIVLSQPVLPLDRLQALVARGALMITGDTGPRHLAVAFDRPVVCLIGPTALTIWAPLIKAC